MKETLLLAGCFWCFITICICASLISYCCDRCEYAVLVGFLVAFEFEVGKPLNQQSSVDCSVGAQITGKLKGMQMV